MKALIVDDSPSSLAYHCALIDSMGLESVSAAGGREALERYQEQKFDFILLDVEMPSPDGYEVARRIRATESPDEWTPIIFLTGRTDEESLSKGIEAGGDDYLAKPVSELVLAAKMAALRRLNHIRSALVTTAGQLRDTNHLLWQANEKLKTIAAVDGLTGIANRRRLDEMLGREWGRAIREHTPLSVLMADVDFFKLYNDSYGHQAGDDCLRKISGALALAARRPGDLAARYGGEEFAIVLPNTPLEGARHVAQFALEKVLSLGIPHKASKVRDQVSISIGVASVCPDTAKCSCCADLVKMADRALYEAKERGRARVVWAESTPSETV
ncbi:MAG: diguanylate cyclase [Rhodocyclaceae bacterium]|nr:diguanylate cyclase [Rhodocyclaceae bacterium]